MSDIDLKEVISASAINAYKEYVEMTLGDCGIVHTPEYWYTTKIGIGIKKAMSEYAVILETPMSEFHEFSEIRQGRTSDAYRKSGQTDIGLWSYDKNKDNWKPHGIIEVKKAWGWNDNIEADIARIYATMRESKNVKVGYFVALTDAVTENENGALKKIENRIETFKKTIEDQYDNPPITVTEDFSYCDNEESSSRNNKVIAAAMVFKLRLKETKG